MAREVVYTTGLEKARRRVRGVKVDIRRAEVRAVNKTVRGLRAATSKEVRKRYALKASVIKQGVGTKRADQSQTTIRAYLNISGRGIGLEQFGNPRPTAKGVSVTVARAKGRVLFEHAFFRPDRPGIWKRVKDKRGGDVAPSGLVGRVPVRRLFGPSLAAIWGDIRVPIMDQADALLRKRFFEELRFELSKTK